MEFAAESEMKDLVEKFQESFEIRELAENRADDLKAINLQERETTGLRRYAEPEQENRRPDLDLYKASKKPYAREFGQVKYEHAKETYNSPARNYPFDARFGTPSAGGCDKLGGLREEIDNVDRENRKIEAEIKADHRRAGAETREEGQPFKVEYPDYDERVKNVQMELDKLKILQRDVLAMKSKIEQTIERELAKSLERASAELRAKYRARLSEIQKTFRRKEGALKKVFEAKLAEFTNKLKAKAKEVVEQAAKREGERVRGIYERKLLEARVRNREVLDKVSKMYIDLREKYRTDIQGIKQKQSKK